MLEHRMKTFKTQILEQTTQQSSTKRTSTVSVCLKQSQSHTPTVEHLSTCLFSTPY